MIDRIEVFITNYQSPEPLERFVFSIRTAAFSLENQIDLKTKQKIEKSLSQFFLPILLSEAHYQSRACKFLLHLHLLQQTFVPADPDIWLPASYVPMTSPQVQKLEEMQCEYFSIQSFVEKNL